MQTPWRLVAQTTFHIGPMLSYESLGTIARPLRLECQPVKPLDYHTPLGAVGRISEPLYILRTKFRIRLASTRLLVAPRCSVVAELTTEFCHHEALSVIRFASYGRNYFARACSSAVPNLITRVQVGFPAILGSKLQGTAIHSRQLQRRTACVGN